MDQGITTLTNYILDASLFPSCFPRSADGSTVLGRYALFTVLYLSYTWLEMHVYFSLIKCLKACQIPHTPNPSLLVKQQYKLSRNCSELTATRTMSRTQNEGPKIVVEEPRKQTPGGFICLGRMIAETEPADYKEDYTLQSAGKLRKQGPRRR